jgi:hypothetical protein
VLSFSYIDCWASSGYNVQGCAALEQQLRACMDAPVGSRVTITIHLYGEENSSGKLDLTLTAPWISEASAREEEHNQLPSLETVPKTYRTAQTKVIK